MNTTQKTIFLVFLAMSLMLFTACEDVVDITLDQHTPQLTVDAFLNDKAGDQTVVLTMSSPYFDSSTPRPALGATVKVQDNQGNNYDFLDKNNNGKYIYTPIGNEKICKLGNVYKLTVQYQGETYEANSIVNRVPVIDSLTYKFEEERLGRPEGYYAEVYAKDFVGQGDCYWIRGFKNGRVMNRAQQIVVAYDGAFSPGGSADGITFIRPLRTNALEETLKDANNKNLPPFVVGDIASVEIHSITPDAFYFFNEMSDQLLNGGLFARPPYNIRTNIKNTKDDSNLPASKKAIGFFCTSLTNSATIKIEKKN